MVNQLSTFHQRLNILNLCTDGLSFVQQQHALNQPLDLLITTPSRLVPLFPTLSPRFFSSLRYLVIDEADLVLSFGYEDDLLQLFPRLPQPCSTYQTLLISATSPLTSTGSSEKETLQSWTNVAHSCLFEPEWIQVMDTETRLHQYHLKVKTDQDKFLVMYVLKALNVVQGSLLVFMNQVERCMKLHLVLQQFGIVSGVLNATLPIASRMHTIHLFNTKKINLLITTDEDSSSSKHHEFSMARGIDFHGVSVVINVDPPLTQAHYLHRVGRTARAGASGMSIVFLSPNDLNAHNTTSLSTERRKEEEKEEKEEDPFVFRSKLQDLPVFPMPVSLLDRFRYRFQDTLRSVTKTQLLQAQRQVFVQALRTAKTLTHYFEMHPTDAKELASQAPNFNSRLRQHTKHLIFTPNYLVPSSSNTQNVEIKVTQVPFLKKNKPSKQKSPRFSSSTHPSPRNQAIRSRKQVDPLKWGVKKRKQIPKNI
ncbi:ATP-dependent DNA/RNA helicase [Coelomomyces lativittatus]|nr:ATP-dependent DNA/RNA helicase [Coelomomyces lativittatus]